MSHDSRPHSALDHRSRAVRAATGRTHEATSAQHARIVTNPNTPALHRPDANTRLDSLLHAGRRPSRHATTLDASSHHLSGDLVTRFIDQLSCGAAEQAFLPYLDYCKPFADHDQLDLASYFWNKAGPSTKGNRACWSWRYLAGCALMVDPYPINSPVKYSKQDRSEWRKVAKFANTVIARSMPHIGQLAYVILDTLAANSGLCRVLRKLPQHMATSEAIITSRKLTELTLPNIDFVTNSMDVLRVFENLTILNHDQIARKINMADVPSRERHGSTPLPVLPWMSENTIWHGSANSSSQQSQVNTPSARSVDPRLDPGPNQNMPRWEETSENTIFPPTTTAPELPWDPVEDHMGFQWRQWDYMEATDASSNNTSEFGNSPSSGSSGEHTDFLPEGYSAEWPQAWGLLPDS